MSFSPREKRAIGYVARANGWKLTLQAGRPSVYFLDQKGETIKHDMASVLAWYDQGRKEDAKLRRQEKKNSEASRTSGYSFSR